MDEPLLAPGTVLDSKFRIVRCIGSGGMGAVYQVQHELTHHHRALKLLHPASAKQREAVERFLREASAAGRIGNPHITETYDAGWLAEGAPYLLMELLEGETLGERIEREGALPLDLVLAIAAQCCDGLAAAHDAGVIHRDLKPDNLFLADPQGEPFVKILDFGISKFEDLGSSRSTVDGAFMGTPWYMSPEQFADGKHVDARADLYALGVILFEALTGSHPYPDTDTIATLATKVLFEEIPPPSAIRTGLPPGIDAVIARALRKDPADRYPDARAMRDAIDTLRESGGRTLPQGSFWADELPARGARRERDADVSNAPTTLASPTMLASPGPAAEEAPSAGPDRRPLRAAVAAGVLLAAGALVWLASREPEAPATRSDGAETAATGAATPIPSTAAPSPPAPSASAARPSSAPAASASSAPAPPPPRPAPAPKPKPDFATMEEFPG